MTKTEKITERLGFSACCIASERTVLGVARMAGFDILTDPAFTGNLDTDIHQKSPLRYRSLKNL